MTKRNPSLSLSLPSSSFLAKSRKRLALVTLLFLYSDRNKSRKTGELSDRVLLHCSTKMVPWLIIFLFSLPLLVCSMPLSLYDDASEMCFQSCVIGADLSLWPTTPPADEDDEEPRCKSVFLTILFSLFIIFFFIFINCLRTDIRFTSECVEQCQDQSAFRCIAEAISVPQEQILNFIEQVSLAKYCQGCQFFDNDECFLTPRLRNLLNSTNSNIHPKLAALAPFTNGLYVLPSASCWQEKISLYDYLTNNNAVADYCE